MFDGATSTAVPNAVVMRLASAVNSSVAGVRIVLQASYTAADNHYRHLFNLDDFAAVIHQSATQTQVWVGNNNAESYGCGRGFAVNGFYSNGIDFSEMDPAWPPGAPALLSFSYLANNTIGDMFVNGVAMRAADSTYENYHSVWCTPILIPNGTTTLIGGSGDAGYNNNFAGTMTFFALDY